MERTTHVRSRCSFVSRTSSNLHSRKPLSKCFLVFVFSVLRLRFLLQFRVLCLPHLYGHMTLQRSALGTCPVCKQGWKSSYWKSESTVDLADKYVLVGRYHKHITSHTNLGKSAAVQHLLIDGQERLGKFIHTYIWWFPKTGG